MRAIVFYQIVSVFSELSSKCGITLRKIYISIATSSENELVYDSDKYPPIETRRECTNTQCVYAPTIF